MGFAPSSVWRCLMRSLVLTRPTFGFVLGTRVALGVGVGLLIADRLSASRRRQAGGTLVAIGALTTIPAALLVLRGLRRGRFRAAMSERRPLPDWCRR